MPVKLVHALGKATQVKAKPQGVHADGGGLYLVVSDTGARWWQWRGAVFGRRTVLGIGGFPAIGLADAREKAAEFTKIARSGGDPKAERDKARRASLTFREAARKVWKEQIEPNNKNAKHVAQWLSTLETYAFKKIGSIPVHAVNQADILRVLQPIWLEKPETARRVRQRLRAVFDWAIVAQHREAVNPVEAIEVALPEQRDKVQHFTAPPWRDLPDLWKRIAVADGMGAVALRFTILTAARSGEVRGATWVEMDLEAGVWTIPAERMKAGVAHRVPLSPSALALLSSLRPVTGGAALVFPSSKRDKPLSDMTLAAVLKRLKVPVTVHGFRSTFRDWSEDATAYPHEVKEAALAHTVKNRVEAAYRRTDLFDRRRAMMDEWAAYVTGAPAA